MRCLKGVVANFPGKAQSQRITLCKNEFPIFI